MLLIASRSVTLMLEPSPFSHVSAAGSALGAPTTQDETQRNKSNENRAGLSFVPTLGK